MELLITILPKPSDEEHGDWARLSLESLARAYGDDEPEYSLDLSKRRTQTMKEGDVVIVPMPQADGMSKNRPAIVLREMPPFEMC